MHSMPLLHNATRTLSFAGVIALAVSPPPTSTATGEVNGRAPHAVAAVDSLGDRLRRELTPWLAQQAAADAYSGVVLVTRNGVPIYSAAYGMADRARGVANTLDTRFNLGSMNKMWTAIAVAQLVEQGKIDLEAPVGRYLPDLPNAAVREKVLVKHLLTHTSGLGTYMQNGFLRNKTYASRVSDYLPFFINDSLAFAPGARMQYSNAGFALLGLLVERVSGVPYWEYMQKNVLDRAGMKRAAFVDVRSHPRSVAIGYARPPGATAAVENWDFIEQRSSPDGGAFASAPDIVAFSRALFGGRLVKPSLAAEFTSGKVPMGPSMQYAYGFGVGTIVGVRTVGHNGGIAGANAEFMAIPDSGLDVVVLANMDGPVATNVAFRVMGLVAGLKKPLQVQLATDDNPPAATSAGADPAAGAKTIPDTPAGRRATAYLRAYADGSAAALTTFIEQNMMPNPERPVVDRVVRTQDMLATTGSLTFDHVVRSRPDEIAIAVESAKNGPLMLTVAVEPGTPNRIISINVEPGRP